MVVIGTTWPGRYGRQGLAWPPPGHCDALLINAIPLKLIAGIQGEPLAASRTSRPPDTASFNCGISAACWLFSMGVAFAGNTWASAFIHVSAEYKRRTIFRVASLMLSTIFLAMPVAGAQVITRASHRALPALAASKTDALHTHGNKLLYANNKIAILHGVVMAAKPGTPNWSHLQQSTAAAVKTWKSRLIGLPLSQDAWFGKLPNSRHGGAVYRHAIDSVVQYCAAHGAYIDLTLQWTDIGHWGKYLGRHRMPDGNSVRFWRAVASRYKNYPNVLFGLFASASGVDWHTWLYGGVCTHESATRVVAYRAAGMQELYHTVRATGAENIVLAPGCRGGADLFGVIHGFAVRGRNIMYSTNIYAWVSSHVPITQWARQWRQHFELPAQHVPVLVAQWGGGRKGAAYKHLLLKAMKKRDISWTAVNFGVGPPWPALIKNWQYQPTKLGNLVKHELAKGALASEAVK